MALKWNDCGGVWLKGVCRGVSWLGGSLRTNITVASKLYGVNATIIIFVFVLYCIILYCIVLYCIVLFELFS